VKATNAYAAKRALVDRLTVLAMAGQPLEGVQVADTYPRNISDRCVYGGGARFTQTQESAEPGGLRFETVSTGLYVRVFGRGLSVRETETIVEGYGDIVGDLLAKDPDLGGGLTFTQITAGAADFYPGDDGVEAILALSVDVESHLP
jgi:hypothetical protein